MKDLVTNYDYKLIEAGCAPVSGRYGLQLNTANDISPVFPYLNALLNETRFDHQNGVLIWREGQKAFALRSHEIKIVQEKGLEDVEGRAEAAKAIVEQINSAWHNRDQITPCFTSKGLPPTIEIYKLLPKTNCKRCGYPTCLAFAADLRDGKAKLEQCTPILGSEFADNKQKLVCLLFPV